VISQNTAFSSETDGGIFFFGKNLDLNSITPQVVGSKAYNLMKMTNLGLPVPPAFVLSTQYCQEYFKNERRLPINFEKTLQLTIDEFEKIVYGKTISKGPLLVSVRSGAAVSMPGMMDTILNVGLNDSTITSLIRMTGNPRFAWDSYRRLVESYGDVVAKINPASFDSIIRQYLQQDGLEDVQELSSEQLKNVTRDFLLLYKEKTGLRFPQSLYEQLLGAIRAVFESWENPRAIEYRRINGLANLSGTAVIVQLMVFGNMGVTSGSGVGFTRNPTNGDNELYLDYLSNAQGEDVVSGRYACKDVQYLQSILPSIYDEIKSIKRNLELYFMDAQDFEFTIQEGKIYLLQTRSAKRTPWAALKTTVDLVNEGIIDKTTGKGRLAKYDLGSIHRKRILVNSQPLSTGTPASHGVAFGRIALSVTDVKNLGKSGEPIVLVREDFSTNDLEALNISEGILTVVGGKTSHAAVVARQLDKICIVGCKDLMINNEYCVIAGRQLKIGDFVTLDANTGNVYEGKIPVELEKPNELVLQVNSW
jgi:pyruvate,orthophosphate dikinase